MGWLRFIRCASDHVVLNASSAGCWRYCSDAMLRCSSDHPVLKTSLQRAWHALWYILRWLLRRPNLASSDHPVPLGFSPTNAANCTDAKASVYPVATGCSGAPASDHLVLLGTAELVHFIFSLSYFFVFCFAWLFCFIPRIYNCSLDKLISPNNYVVTQSPKSQNNGLMGPFSLQDLRTWKIIIARKN